MSSCYNVGRAALWVFCGAVCWATVSVAQQTSPKTDALRRVEADSIATGTLTVEIVRPINLFQPDQGEVIYSVQITRGNNRCFMIKTPLRLPDPRYYAPTGVSRYHDIDGRLKLWMETTRAVSLEEDGLNEYYEGIAFLIEPDGSIAERNKGISIERRRPSDTNTIGMNLLRRILWALGRPDGSGLYDVVEDKVIDNGERVLSVIGSWAAAPFGARTLCTMTVEPENGYLVRKASFGGEGGPPRSECHCEGTRRFGDVVFAEQGEFTLHSVETLKVRIVSFSKSFDEQVAEQARNAIKRALSHTVQVFDYRQHPMNPEISLMQPGELDLSD